MWSGLCAAFVQTAIHIDCGSRVEHLWKLAQARAANLCGSQDNNYISREELINKSHTHLDVLLLNIIYSHDYSTMISTLCSLMFSCLINFFCLLDIQIVLT